jgi:hypothetical protein
MIFFFYLNHGSHTSKCTANLLLALHVYYGEDSLNNLYKHIGFNFVLLVHVCVCMYVYMLKSFQAISRVDVELNPISEICHC